MKRHLGTSFWRNEEYTQICANELAILKFCQASTARKRPGSVELERQGLLIGEDR
jgi:hypothetical protein